MGLVLEQFYLASLYSPGMGVDLLVLVLLPYTSKGGGGGGGGGEDIGFRSRCAFLMHLSDKADTDISKKDSRWKKQAWILGHHAIHCPQAVRWRPRKSF